MEKSLAETFGLEVLPGGDVQCLRPAQLRASGVSLINEYPFKLPFLIRPRERLPEDSLVILERLVDTFSIGEYSSHESQRTGRPAFLAWMGQSQRLVFIRKLSALCDVQLFTGNASPEPGARLEDLSY